MNDNKDLKERLAQLKRSLEDFLDNLNMDEAESEKKKPAKKEKA